MRKVVLDGKTIYKLGPSWVYGEDIMACFAVVAIFAIGAIMVQLGRQMDQEVERQHRAEMAHIAQEDR
mgnify:CR=1 FL=1